MSDGFVGHIGLVDPPGVPCGRYIVPITAREGEGLHAEGDEFEATVKALAARIRDAHVQQATTGSVVFSPPEEP